MSLTYNFLSGLTNISQLTMSQATRQKFISAGVISGTQNNGFDDLRLPDNKNLKLAYPDCIFNKIPYKVNTVAFLVYLGLKEDSARKVFNDAVQRTHGVNLNGEDLWNQLLLYTEDYPSIKSCFRDDINVDIRRLEEKASQTPAIMNSYIARVKPGSAFADLKPKGFAREIFNRGIANLLGLDQSINQYLSG